MGLTTVLSTFLAALVSYILFKFLTTKNPYHDFPVAERQSWILGNEGERDSGEAQAGTRLVQCAREFDSDVFRLPEPLGAESLVVGDPLLLNYILSDVRKFPSTPLRTSFIRFLIGDGIVSAPPHEHAKQRRIMGPAFTQLHIRQMSPVFTSKAEELSQKIREIVNAGGQPRWNTEKQSDIVNVTEFLDAAAFDIISLAGMGRDSECLKNGQSNVELAHGYNSLLQASVKFSLPRILLLIVAGILNADWVGLPFNEVNRTIIAQNKKLEAWTAKVIEEKIQRITAELDDGVEAQDKPGFEDLVEIIVRTNLEMKRQGKANIMSPKEIQGQIQVLLFAGYETSSSTTSMCLHYLAHNQEVQDRLRKEINDYIAEVNAATGDTNRTQLTAEEMQSPKLHLLGNCIKETLRLAPAVTVSQRSVMEDCVAPLTRPIRSRDGGETKTQVILKKGTRVGCCFKLAAMNEEYWGEKPDEWNPDRLDNLPEAYQKTSMPGPVGLPTFSNGPASCLGSRFAMLEMTALLVALIHNHRFEPSAHRIVAKQVIVLRPTVIGQDVAALPLKVTNL